MATGSKLKVGFLGAGKMSTALAQGFLKANLLAREDILASDFLETARLAFSNATGCQTRTFNLEVVESSTVVILGVKPDQVAPVLTEIRPAWRDQHLLISVAAGITLSTLEGFLGAGARVVRVMPNTPALVGAGASGYALNRAALPEDSQLAERLLSSVGLCFQLKEPLLDAVTGLSGSGPAYAYQFIEALSDGGVASGLPREVATRLAAQTVLGAARMVLETGQHPGALKDMVTSPGGTTIEGIHELEKGGLRGTVINAVRAATQKSKHLGQNSADPTKR